jgi:asparagine synthase (glutamine-hydrolysing)
MGHTRLAIIDLSRESHQPMVVPGEAALVFNGEIYNYVELRRDLELAGHAFRSSGDTEVLLRSWLAWGPAFVHRLRGFFGLALWDPRGRELVAARDRLGKKPLYYAPVEPDGLIFASEIGALWSLGAGTPRLDPGVAARYLAVGELPREGECFFRGIRQVPPGGLLRWSPGGAPRVEVYWRPVATHDARPADAARQLRERLDESVALRYRSDVPVGVALSGGVDSGSLLATSVAVRDRIGQGTVLSYSATHEEDRFSEEAEIRAVLAGFPDVNPTFFATAENSTLEDFLAFLRHHDEPVRSDGVFNQYRFMQRMREAGIKVLLSGQGSDELFFGYPWHMGPWVRWLLGHGRVVEAVRWAGELGRRQGQGTLTVLRGIVSRMWPGRTRAYKARAAGAWLRPGIWAEHCAAAFETGLEVFRDPRVYHLDQLYGTSLGGLLKDEDRNSMGSGVETRLPYLDPPLVEWALGLDPALAFREGMTKHVVRSAFLGDLPHSVAMSRRKRGFYMPYMHRWEGFPAVIRETLTASEALGEVVDVGSFLALCDEGRVDDQLRWRCFNLAFSHRAALERAGSRGEPPAGAGAAIS